MADERGSKDLVLAPGEYAYVADDTKGGVDVCVGPFKLSLAGKEVVANLLEGTPFAKHLLSNGVSEGAPPNHPSMLPGQ